MPKPEDNFTSHLIHTNGIQLHYIEYKGADTTIICLHGLTANAHAFDGLVAKGLAPAFHIIAPDLRGRGLSDRPAFAYTMNDHAEDILGLLDHLSIDKAIIMGHSFGGLFGMYLASNYPERVEKLIILDAAAEMNPRTLEMLGPSLGRLDAQFASWDEYITQIKSAPFNDPWSDDMLSYYQADVMKTETGGVTSIPNLANIIDVSKGVANVAWDVIISKIFQPAILINGLDAYTLGEPLLPETKAQETVAMMPDCTYVPIDGNHHTMLYGIGASEIVNSLKEFLEKG